MLWTEYECRVTLSFANPLDVPLTNCKVSLECSGAILPMRENVQDVEAKGQFSHELTVIPRKQPFGSSGAKKTLAAVFSSNEMYAVNGSVEVEITNLDFAPIRLLSDLE